MTAPTSVVGNEGIHITLAPVVDGVAGTAVNYSSNVKRVSLGSEDKDDSDLTFEEATGGETKNYNVTLGALFAVGTGTLWRLLWDNPGGEFDVVYGPHGNTVESATEPHFKFRVKADGKPPMAQTARRGKDREEFEYTMQIQGDIALDDSAV